MSSHRSSASQSSPEPIPVPIGMPQDPRQDFSRKEPWLHHFQANNLNLNLSIPIANSGLYQNDYLMMQGNRQYVPNQSVVGYNSSENSYGSCALIGGYTAPLPSAHPSSYNLNLRLRPHDFSINNIAL